MTDPQPEASQPRYRHSPRVRNPLRIALALWRVVRDLRNTYEAGIVEMAFARSRRMRRFARWDQMIARLSEQHPQVRAAFRERRRLGWIDVEALSRLPQGTFGRVFADHLRANGLDPNLVDVPVEDDASYFLAHAFETHDIWHVVSGCGNDEPGEFAVAGFYAAQTEASFFAFLLGLAFLNTAFAKPDQLRERMEGLARGFLAGRQARPLFGTDWAALWSTPIEDVRRDLGIDPHPLYAGRGMQEAA
jgi:ubiquinone biosynthesis protein COQ4